MTFSLSESLQFACTMTPACSSKILGAELALGLNVNYPDAAATIPLQHTATHVWRPTGTIASSLAPPSGVDMQAGWLADLGMHQPMHIQQSVSEIDILPLPKFHPTHLQENADNGSANLPALPHVFGNPLSQSIGASAFQDFSSSGRALSRSASYAESSNHARFAATATHDLPGLLGLDGDRELERLQELEPLEPLTDEEVELLHRLLPNDQCQSKENASSLSPLQQVRKPYPNPFGEPIQEVSYDLSSSQASGSMQPLGTVRFSESPVQRSPYVLPALIPHEPRIGLGMGVQQGVGYASSSSSRPFPSSQLCAMDSPPYTHSGLLPTINQEIVQAASPGNMAVEDVQRHLPASTAKPMWVNVRNRSTNTVLGIGGGACLPTELLTAGPRRGQANNRLPKRPRAKVRKSRKAAPSPAMQRLMGMPTMKKDTAQALVEQMATQRDKRIRSERGRRMNTRKMYGDIRNLLPSNAQEMQARLDNATTVMEMMKYIQFCQMQEKMLKEQLKQLQAEARSTTTSSTDYSTTISLLQTPESSAVLTLATMPAVGSDWRPSSLLGSNLTIDVTWKTCCLNVRAPQHRSLGLLDRFVSTLEDHHLKVFHVTLVTRELMIEYSLLCEVNPHVELQRNNLHTALQNIVHNIVHSFASASSSQGGRV